MKISTFDSLRKLTHQLSRENPIITLSQYYSKDEGVVNHMHYGLEIGILIEGAMQRTYDEIEFTCRSGDIWFSGIWEPHGHLVIKEPCLGLVFIALPEYIKNLRFAEQQQFDCLSMYTLPAKNRPVIPEKNRKVMKDFGFQILQKLHHQSNKFPQLWKHLYHLETLLLVQELSNIDSEPVQTKQISKESITVISRAIQYTFSIKRFISVEEVALHCGLNRINFTRLFKKEMGIEFPKFALRYRLSQFANELIETDKPIKALVYEWGFSDESHLYKVFKDHYKQTPLEFRERNII